MLCSDQVSEISWGYHVDDGGLIQRSKQPSSSSSSLPTNGIIKPEDSGGHIAHVAEYYSNTDIKSVLTGGMATFDVYSFPDLNRQDQISSSKISVANENNSEFNAVVAGWTVNPSVYGDSKTHFFTEWTADKQASTGCYDLACNGFVPVNDAPITPGDILQPNNGQLKITIKIFKNKDDGDWWLHFGYSNDNNLRPVGFWPKSLFTTLVDHANLILWGGYTQSYTGYTSPPMGNGQWPGKNSATVRDVKYVDPSGQGYNPAPWPAGLNSRVSHKQCYQVSPFLDGMFYYGGPGGCTV
ncbi:unnamed protein product [Urochloa decumbens]|uniref:Neprosin PEP catalytic domain-containing protein n=1 Tax=Urochloa decumbens TaxID=240449 RepID=A0ABC9E791_9POAL